MKRIIFILMLVISSSLSAGVISAVELFNSLMCDRVLTTPIYTSCYNYTTKGPLAVTYVINKSTVNKVNIKRRPKWTTLKSIPTEYATSKKAVSLGGYDNGHLAPDATFDYDINMLKYTYILGINTVPMDRAVNRYRWLKAENISRKLAVKYDKVTVMDIPVFVINGIKLSDGTMVPLGMYKILTYNGTTDCYYYNNFSNSNEPKDTLLSHKVKCESIILNTDLGIKLYK